MRSYGVHPKRLLTGYVGWLTSRIGVNESVLDYGCGDGHVLNALKLMGHKGGQVGLDRDGVVIGSVRPQYDVAILSNILEHLPNPTIFLHDQIRTSRILIRVPLFDREWRVAVKKDQGVKYFLDKEHIQELTAIEWANLLKFSGWQVIEEETHWGEWWAVCTRIPK